MTRRCPVIEHVHCIINEKNKILTRGRFWLDTYYRDEIESFDAIYKDFQRLVRMMKKRIAYKDYQFENGQSADWPISQKAVELINSGYRRGW